jgi:site-specific recombinase
MIEEEEIKQGEGASLHYDFAKFLTTLSLVALGGVLGLTEKIDHSLAKPLIVGFVAFSIGLAGVSALSAAAGIAGIALGKRARGLSPRINLMIAMLLLGMGAGGFVMIWLRSL